MALHVVFTPLSRYLDERVPRTFVKENDWGSYIILALPMTC
jgi:hypothetical protein